MYGMHVQQYSFSQGEHDTVRRRKLLLNAKEIIEISLRTQEKGLTLVPMRVYFKDGRAKIELGLARGKRSYDKRHAIAERDANRDTARALKERQRDH